MRGSIFPFLPAPPAATKRTTRPTPNSMTARLASPDPRERAAALEEQRRMAAQAPYSGPIGPGGVTGAPSPPLDDVPSVSAPRPRPLYAPTVRDPGRLAALEEMHGAWGAEAGRLASEGRYLPRYRQPDPGGSDLAEQFGGRAPPLGPGGVVGSSPTQRAAQETGIPSSFLDTLVRHESGGNPRARAQTSSAEGPGQFIDSTWRRMMREHGARYGLPADATDAEIMSLRTNPQWAALMTAEYAHENRRAMSSALGRPITEGEAYLGHFLGPGDAVSLIDAARMGLTDARRFVSRAAVDANRSVFYRRDGRPRTAREVLQLQTSGRGFGGDALGDRPDAMR